jgi:hypothetical protein
MSWTMGGGSIEWKHKGGVTAAQVHEQEREGSSAKNLFLICCILISYSFSLIAALARCLVRASLSSSSSSETSSSSSEQMNRMARSISVTAKEKEEKEDRGEG